MKIFAFSRNGFLYIDAGQFLISQQTTSNESNMLNKYGSLPEYSNIDDAKEALAKTKKPKITGIERRFQEAMLNDMDYGQPVEGDYVPDISHE